MKKKTIYTLMIVAVFAFMAAPVAFACDGTADGTNTSAKAGCSSKSTDAKLTSVKADGSAKGTDAKLTSGKAACASKGASATLTSSKTCTPEELAACAKQMKMSKEECANLCDSKGTMTAFEVKGMTCGGCENALTTALNKVDGVYHVASVSYKNEQAIICYDKEKASSDSFIKAITDKGYTAQIIPAVATTVDGNTKSVDGKKACSAKSGSTASSSCSKKKTAEKTADKSDGSL